jgi:hypothetical protein
MDWEARGRTQLLTINIYIYKKKGINHIGIFLEELRQTTKNLKVRIVYKPISEPQTSRSLDLTFDWTHDVGTYTSDTTRTKAASLLRN